MGMMEVNRERYSDPTAERAIGNIIREEKRKQKREKQKRKAVCVGDEKGGDAI